tara:strand:+ start:5209 stop:6492 length:1284 start_codon:yes stop_codon:yes gene_type:complete
MALVDSNTYTEPTAGTSLSTARLQQNQSYRSLLTNFSGEAPPVGVNLTAVGDPLSVSGSSSAVNGMMYHHSNANINALYISSINHSQGRFSGTNFTRRGIFRNEENMGALTANANFYEIGELVSTSNNASSANSRLYLATSNAAGAAKFIDVGVPPTDGSISNTMISLATSDVGGISTDRMNVTSIFNTGSGSTNVTLALQSHFNHGGSGASATHGANVTLGFNTQNSASNAAIVFYGAGVDAGVGNKSGFRVVDKTQANLVPFAANVILQSTKGASSTTAAGNEVAPLLPVGSIIVWPETTAPAGYAIADGTAINRTTFAGLFALIGTDYGTGDGSTTFNLPDFRDRLPLGKGTNNGTVATAQGSMAASSKITTDSGTAQLSASTTTVAASAKDSSTVSVVSGVTAGGHTHTATIPTLCINYIIKT